VAGTSPQPEETVAVPLFGARLLDTTIAARELLSSAEARRAKFKI
jgi:hypothetical protein